MVVAAAVGAVAAVVGHEGVTARSVSFNFIFLLKITQMSLIQIHVSPADHADDHADVSHANATIHVLVPRVFDFRAELSIIQPELLRAPRLIITAQIL